MEARIRRTHAAFARGLDYHRQFLDRLLPPRGLVAEVGCAEARVGTFYQSAERQFIGIDTDREVIEAAMKLGAPKLICASAFDMPLGDASVDAYVGLGIFELDGAGGEIAAKEAARVLKPGGLLYISVPYRNRKRQHGAAATWRGIQLPSFSEESARGLLVRHGFEMAMARPSSIAHGIGPFRRLASVCRGLLVRERGPLYRLLGPVLRPYANSLLVVAYKKP